jgi:N-acetylmuramoyl-L-alanine amidase
VKPSRYTDLLRVPCSNFSSRDGRPVDTGVIHYTGGASGRNTVRWLQTTGLKQGCHILVDRCGEIFQLVAFDKKAWHAGVSECVSLDGREMRGDVNNVSIGIELANWGLLHRDSRGVFWGRLGETLCRYDGPEPERAALRYDTGHEIDGWWEPYAPPQIDALESLCNRLIKDGLIKAFVGHDEIGLPLGRKMDPGPLFPWSRFVHLPTRRTESVRYVDTSAIV